MYTLVLDGGGSYGIAYIGVIKALEQAQKLKDFTTFFGCSVGSIFSLLIVLGYSPAEIQDIIFKLNFDKMYSLSAINILKRGHYGDIKYIMKIINTALSMKFSENITFAELYHQTNKTLIISTVCICDNNPVYFSHKTHPDVQVSYAVRMSISLPYIFPFVEYREKYYADGGICQLPLHLYNGTDHLIFTFEKQISEMTFEHKKKDKYYIVKQLIQTIGRYNDTSQHNIIKIPIKDLDVLSNPSTEQKLNMIRDGFVKTIDFLKQHHS